VETGTIIGVLEGHTGSVYSVAHSPDGQHITSGSYDRTIRIWDARTGAAIGQSLEGHTSSVACSLMGSTSFLDLMTILFESGMPGLELQLASHFKGIPTLCFLLPALLMGNISFLDLVTGLFESGMPGLDLQLASHLRGILTQCGLLPALLMGSTSFPDLLTAVLECGMLGLMLQMVNLYVDTLVDHLLFFLLTNSVLSQDLVTREPVCANHLHIIQSNIPLSQCMLIYLPSQMQKVGSKTHRVVYYIGYPQPIVKPCILLLL
jgi:hypothetical protein